MSTFSLNLTCCTPYTVFLNLIGRYIVRHLLTMVGKNAFVAVGILYWPKSPSKKRGEAQLCLTERSDVHGCWVSIWFWIFDSLNDQWGGSFLVARQYLVVKSAVWRLHCIVPVIIRPALTINTNWNDGRWLRVDTVSWGSLCSLHWKRYPEVIPTNGNDWGYSNQARNEC